MGCHKLTYYPTLDLVKNEYKKELTLNKSALNERSAYLYSFGGMERDDEIKGGGNSYTTMFRQYDPRLGRWLSLDPLAKKFPSESPYVAFHNNPLVWTDPRGDCPDCHETWRKVTTAINSDLTSAWGKSTGNPEAKLFPEFGGIIITNPTSGDIKVFNAHMGSKGTIMMNYSNIPEGYEITGEYHTHPYSSKEIARWKKDGVSSFDGNGVGFDSHDLTNTLGKKHVKKGFTFIIEAGDTRFGIVVEDPELTKAFLKYGAGLIDDFDREVQYDIADGKEKRPYAEASWEKFKELITGYEKESGKSAGFSIFRDSTKAASSGTETPITPIETDTIKEP